MPRLGGQVIHPVEGMAAQCALLLIDGLNSWPPEFGQSVETARQPVQPLQPLQRQPSQPLRPV